MDASSPLAEINPPTQRDHQGLARFMVPGLVFALAVMLAASLYLHFCGISRQLFDQVGDHDRNAHYWSGLNMGRDLRAGDVGHLLYDIHKARTWPPLHALLVGLSLAVGGTDFRLAVLPSLAAWVGTALFGFLLARRAVPEGGNLAGLVAALLILSSPALKAYAVDIMIESLGACLSLAALYCYLRVKQEPSPRHGWLLALALSALFFCKYNYYLLVGMALACSELAGYWPWLWQWAGRHWVIRWPWLKGQLWQPLNYPIAISLAVLAVAHWAGPFQVEVSGKPCTIHAGGLLLELPYIFFCLRLGQWWWRSGRQECAKLPEAGRPLVYGHAFPVMLWLLWPQRFSYFVWYIAAPHGARPDASIPKGLAYYWECLVQDYHWALPSALFAFGMAMVAVLARRWLRPGGQAVLWFIILAALLTVRHPNQKSRCLHSWVAGTWVAAGMGLAFLAYGPGRGRWATARPWLATTAAAGVGAALLPGMLDRGHAPEGGPRPYQTAALDMIEWYLPYLAGSERAAVIGTVPLKFQALWTSLERHGCRPRIECEAEGFHATLADHPDCLESWLATTSNDTLVFVDIALGSYFWCDSDKAPYGRLRTLLPAQERFVFKGEREYPGYGCRLSVWRRCP